MSADTTSHTQVTFQAREIEKHYWQLRQQGAYTLRQWQINSKIKPWPVPLTSCNVEHKLMGEEDAALQQRLTHRQLTRHFTLGFSPSRERSGNTGQLWAFGSATMTYVLEWSLRSKWPFLNKTFDHFECILHGNSSASSNYHTEKHLLWYIVGTHVSHLYFPSHCVGKCWVKVGLFTDFY